LIKKLPKRGHLGLGRWQPPGDGSFISNVDHFIGCVDELQVWNRPFGQSEIIQNWNTLVTGSEKDLAYQWTMDELKGDL
jgi:hypothetical protein